ncbi:BglII/BstYI family type II restriction endonuclease [Exiguobacterium sp. NG55]|uniref:BglII/BstYI family type II restriction endonuclease n=1 Tax=Exiguobacterium sp. NG55 TaxID=375477 RepID=UPI00068AB492|nr:BglII/BstYI family type II restriction endonuclease [Exiguobacterium sp. NG55]
MSTKKFQRTWIPKPKEQDFDWLQIKTFELMIADSFHYRNSKTFLEVFPKYRDDVVNLFNSPFDDLTPTHGKENNKHYRKISTDEINKAFRKRLSKISDIHLEVSYMDGYLYDNKDKTKGFDFAYYDTELNAKRFHDYCFGHRSISNGEEQWTNFVSEQRGQEYLSCQSLERSYYENFEINAESIPTIVGEIQFANWALGYYDLFKVLHLDNLTGIDLLIYITPTRTLEKKLSSNIVTFDNMKKIIETYSSVLKVPIWLVGIDIKDPLSNK